MEKKDGEENPMLKSDPPCDSAFSDQIPAGTFSLQTFLDLPPVDQTDGEQSSFSISYLDLVPGPEDETITAYSAIFDLLQTPVPPSFLVPPPPQPPSTSPEVAKTPATPISPSLSSSSNEAANKTADEAGEEDPKDKAKQLLKPKKKKQKRQREPRVAFMTKSEADNLDDGYRWRKYGQKAVKNSPFPRSYYRCTAPSCGVKKRVERSSQDPSTIVTTYEGTHIHPCPVTPRTSSLIATVPKAPVSPGVGGDGGGCSTSGRSSPFGVPSPDQFFHYPMHHHHHHQQQQEQQQQQQQRDSFYFESLARDFLPLRFPNNSSCGASSELFSAPNDLLQERRLFVLPSPPPPPPSSSSTVNRNHGLLQDILPSEMRKRQNKDGIRIILS
ncbi:unnamed protein product [Cuscuta epithymum]|uniref:WRKY domain-containing protein n=1 Tax=Cuscuta epithymum TaxID=186058 RepID=A0AAV0F224_9ASTE|nr:unnamed protein product [Cuscuta epithymum]